MRSPRTRMFLSVGLLLAAFLLLDPFDIFSARPVRRPGSDPGVVRSAAAWIEEEHREPQDYLLDRFEEDQVVLLGELGQIRQQVSFVTGFLPLLHIADVHVFATEHLLAEDQKKVDRLVGFGGSPETGNDFDRRAAAQLLLRRNVLGGYEEYVSMIEAVHSFNRSRAEDQEPLRLVALAPRFRYDLIERQEQTQDSEILRQVVGEVTPDRYMADVFARKVLEEGRRALVLLSFPHVFSEYESRAAAEELGALGFDDVRMAGRIIRERAGGGVSTVLMHGPWPDESRPSNLNYAVDGYIDSIQEELPDRVRRAGFDLAGTPPGDLPVTVGQFAGHHDALTLGALADGYITLGPISRYRGASVIPDFYTAGNIEYARLNFPGPTEEELSPGELQEFLRGQANAFDQWIGEFQ